MHSVAYGSPQLEIMHIKLLLVTVRCYTTKENDRRIALYSIHTNPQNSFEHCLGGQDQYIRYTDFVLCFLTMYH